MKYRPLGKTDLNVSVICLGTMTWGEQNTEAEGHAQMDLALERGVNFFDTAELYPVPPNPNTCFRTESVIGTWFASRKNREKVILATKIAGKEPRLAWIRDGKSQFDKKNIFAAVDASLKRLQTDYIDLYQLHWPDRETNYFGQLGYTHHPDDTWVPLEETLGALEELVQSGKVRHVGVSNETPWGVMRYLELANHGNGSQKKLPRIASIQNPYSLLNRSFEVGLAEVAIREQCGLLAYSPMGFGVLSGKYLAETDLKTNADSKARLNLFGGHFNRYSNPQALEATRRYVALAKANGLSPAQMSLAFVNSRAFVTSNIIGATTLEQLKENIESIQVELSAEVLEGIDAIHAEISNPSP